VFSVDSVVNASEAPNEPLSNKDRMSLKEYFLLDPDIVFLNHGSFGASPKPVFEAYQNWQLRLERQPVLFLGRELDALLGESRSVLGKYLNAAAEELVYIPNATHGVNIVARSLHLKPDDEILTTDHEYGASTTLGISIVRKQAHNIFTNPFPCLSIPKRKSSKTFGSVSRRAPGLFI